MPTVVTKTIGASGRDYATIQAFLTACPADLVAADQLWEGVIYPDSGNTYSETGLSSGTHTTDSTRYIRLKAASGASFMDNAGKLTNALRANSANGILLYLGSGATNNIITVTCHFELVGLQIKNDATGNYYGISHTNRLWLRNCIVEAKNITVNGPASQAAVFAYNTVLVSQYIALANAGTVANSTLKGCTICSPSGNAQKPFRSDYMNFLLVDCAWFGYTVLPTAGSGFAAGSSGNTTDQASFPTNVTGTSGLTYANQFVNTGITGATHDLRPKAGNGLGVGTTNSDLTLDIVGQTRAATPTSGAFEYVASGTDATASGATLTGTATLTPGAASGERNVTAPGATLTGTADLAGGAASGTGDAAAPGATLTGTGTLIPGSASGDAAAPGATLTGTASLTPGSASGGSSGTFASSPMENNTGSLLADTAVIWEWRQGAGIGVAPSAVVYGSGTTSGSGILTASGLPAGAGELLVATPDYSSVFYERGTVA